MTIEIVVFAFGALLLFTAILGGGFELKELKVPPVGRWARLSALVSGVILILLGIGLVARPPQDEPAASTTTTTAETTVDQGNLTGTGRPRPTVADDVTPSQLNLTALDEANDQLRRELEQIVDDCASGDDESCQTLLDALVEECDEGYGFSCDVLYQISPSGSDYEAFGATCGGRVDEENAGSCADL